MAGVLKQWKSGAWVTVMGPDLPAHTHSAATDLTGVIADSVLPSRIRSSVSAATGNSVVTDPHSITASGYYYVNNVTTNAPSGASVDYYVHAIVYNGSWMSLRAVDSRTGKTWLKFKNNNTWGSWNELIQANDTRVTRPGATWVASTANTAGTGAGQFAKIATITLSAIYTDFEAVWQMLTEDDGNADPISCRLQLRIRQQNALGGVPVYSLYVDNIQARGSSNPAYLTGNNFRLVITQNNATSTIAEVWMMAPGNNNQYRFYEIAANGSPNTSIAYSTNSVWQAALPAAVNGNAIVTANISPVIGVVNFLNAPTISGAGIEVVSNKSTATALGTSDAFYPTQNAVKSYVDTQIATRAPTAHTHTKANITDFAHTHAIADLPTDATNPAALGTAAPGSASTVARRDHVHAMPTAANVGAEPTIAAGTTSQYWRGDKTWQTLNAAAVGAAAATHAHSLEDVPDAWVKRSVRVASTANVTIPPGGTSLTIDGQPLANGDRVLLKDQTAPSQNGIYVVGGIGSSVTLTRSADADSASEVAGATVNVDNGLVHAGQMWTTSFMITNLLGGTSMYWYRVLDTGMFDNTAPASLGAAASSGSSTVPARRDHVHPYPTAAQVGAAATTHTHVLSDLPDAWVKRSVRAASTANVTIPPGGTALTIDTVALANGDRVLLKDQTTASQNGIYTVGGIGTSVTLTRATDADSSAEIAGAAVNVDQGAQAGQLWSTTFASTGTLGTTSMAWYRVVDTSLANVSGGYQGFIAAGTTNQWYRGDKTWQSITAGTIGAAASSHTHSAADLTSGTVPSGRLLQSTNGLDLNATTETGFYQGSSWTNGPSGVTAGMLIVTGSGLYTSQILQVNDASAIYTRSRNNGTWTAWAAYAPATTRMVVKHNGGWPASRPAGVTYIEFMSANVTPPAWSTADDIWTNTGV